MKMVPKLGLADVRVMVAAAEREAKRIGVDMDIAVCDDGGNLLMFVRMDEARVSSIQIAIDKAFTAACARRSTRDYAASAAPGQPAFGIHASHQGRFAIFPGGLPISVGGHVVGGIGCSSGHPDQDEAVAWAGLNALAAVAP
ncbi:MAG: heme-binding protein [Deltaproteobacteria bacterium]|nr:MAG: heme-binding protein [Deltaproteobacteria bacterium]